MKLAIFETFRQYRLGMAAYDRCHPPTVRGQWDAFRAEWQEFAIEPSADEAWDILHSGGRLVWKLTGLPLQWLAYPTVAKHGNRFASRGCIRSQRNCDRGCCGCDNGCCDSGCCDSGSLRSLI
jgi:hypothetical protein